MKRSLATILAGPLLTVTIIMLVGGATHAQAAEPDGDGLIAIDVLLEPDQAMLERASEVNDQLRANYPAGYKLDASHAPHVTLLQRFVRAKDFDAVSAAVAEVFVAERPTELALKAVGYEYIIWGRSAVTVFVVERTPELMRLHDKVISAVTPFSVDDGTAAAFVGADINSETIGWVATFVPGSSGKNYLPHVTLGVATEDFAKQLKVEPFDAFPFKAAAAAIYQLGNFGTAAKELWQYEGK